MKRILINATWFINWASNYTTPINTIYDVIRELNFHRPNHNLLIYFVFNVVYNVIK